MSIFPDITPSPVLIEKPIFDTIIINYGNKVEQRISQSVSERWEYIVRYNSLSDTDKETIQDFFIARKGSYESFTFNHPRPSQVIGTDAQNWTCILTHDSTADNRPVTGADYATNWELGGDRGLLWVLGRKYKKEFTVRFKEDAANFSYFQYMLWEYGKVELVQVAA